MLQNRKIVYNTKSSLKKTTNKSKKFKNVKPGHFWKGYSKAKWSKMGEFAMTLKSAKTAGKARPSQWSP